MGADDRAVVDWAWLTGEVRAAAAAFVAQLRTIQATSRAGATPVPNLEWDVAELTAHLISLPAVYRAQNALAEPFVPPESWPDFSRASRAHITSTDLGELADMLLDEVDTFLRELDGLGQSGMAPRTLYGQPTTAANLAAGMLSELILHGMDIAAITGSEVMLTKQQALAIIPAMMALVPAFIDPERGRRCEGVYHMKFRGGDEYHFRVTEDGALSVHSGKPDKADCHLIADPATYILLGFERTGQVKAVLTGKIIAYGRKPWLFDRMAKARVDGV